MGSVWLVRGGCTERALDSLNSEMGRRVDRERPESVLQWCRVSVVLSVWDLRDLVIDD